MHGLEVVAAKVAGAEDVLTAPALAFLAELCARFAPRVDELLARRAVAQVSYDRGERPSFSEDTRNIREGQWTVAPIPRDLVDRRVEITGPVDRKMVINALNSGAKVYMADFEDATSPTFENLIAGQLNLKDAIRRSIRYTDESKGKVYSLAPHTATLMVRPRGWHLKESHLRAQGAPIPAALFDFGLYFFHNARELLTRGSGPYFYLPKLESHLEARLWNDVFVYAQNALGLPQGSIKATVLIETLPAAFAMDEILYELREHSAGLNCGRWDYIFSFIKVHRHDPRAVLPDRAQVTMEQPCMRAYSQLAVRTCHRRNVHALGGMAAHIPIKEDPEANATALARVRADKLREVKDGHDGTWVAHPGLVPVAKAIFDQHMPGPNQIDRKRDDVKVEAVDLLRLPTGERSEAGLRHNVRVGIQYIEAWLRGVGCVPLYHLMEDAATAEISRTQIWQWLRHAALIDGHQLTRARLMTVVDEELAGLGVALGQEVLARPSFKTARRLFVDVATGDPFVEFLTLPAYELLVSGDKEHHE